MKIRITGRVGEGKTAIAVFIAQALATKGIQASVAVDEEESNIEDILEDCLDTIAKQQQVDICIDATYETVKYKGDIPCEDCGGLQTWCPSCEVYTQTCCVGRGTCACA
jgi:cytidylate kinase